MTRASFRRFRQIRLSRLIVVALAAAAVPTGAHPAWIQAAKAPGAFIGSGDMMPAIKRQVLPDYPEGAAPAGTVDLEIVVDISGSVAHARVAQSTDASGTFDRACMEAMRAWRLKPAVNASGDAMVTLVQAKFEFGRPTSTGKAGSVSASIVELPQRPPPGWDALGSLVIHDLKEPGMEWPAVIREVKPRYTQQAMRGKVVGAVHMELAVLADGTVGAARVVKSLEPSLDRQALIAARYWYFIPARLNGQPVAAAAQLVLEFRLH
jgi:TonB family protein